MLPHLPYYALHLVRHPQVSPANEEVIHCLLTLVRRGSPGAVKARWYARCNG